MNLQSTLQKIRAGDMKPTELTELTFKKIEKVEPKIHAFITLIQSQAYDRAKSIEKNWNEWKSKKLAGLPVAIKDNILYQGVRTTCGSKILSNFIAPYSATVAEKLVNQGAIIVGKCNQDEFAMGSSTEYSSFGPTSNPWNLNYVPGGSSGGSAAVVASGLVGGSLGTDTGGSIRQPAALCGIVGVKPTYGRVSRYGVIAFASSLDQVGPFARSVEDAALLLECISGHDPKDSTSSQKEVPPWSQLLSEVKMKGFPKMKIGVPFQLIEAGLDQDVKTEFEAILTKLKKLGHEIVQVELPRAKYGIAVYYLVATSEASSNLARFDGVRYGHRSQKARSIHEVFEKSREEGFGPEVKLRIMLGNYSLSSGYYDAYYKKASQVRQLIRDDYAKAFQKCDLILTPTSPSAGFKKGEKTSDPLQMYLSDVFTVPLNLAGIGGMSLPVGFSKAGLPIGAQFAFPPFEELKALKVGAQLESELGVNQKHPEVWGS